jgi:predicted lipid-binding transport protein (Tim44 family)
MAEFQFFDIILLAMVAGFIFLRLRNVLGRRTGHHQRPSDLARGRGGDSKDDDDTVIPLPDRNRGEADTGARSPLDATLASIQLADRSFDPESFIGGARAAYEMIVSAFAAGDEASLENLVSDDVLQRFRRVIREREEKGLQHETTIIGQDTAEIVDASLEGKQARVSVKFVSQLVNVTRDADGKVVDGDPNRVDRITEIWTFERNVKSRDPNWLLVATRVPH